MESLCLRQNRRFHIRQLADDGISVLIFYLIFKGLIQCVNNGEVYSPVHPSTEDILRNADHSMTAGPKLPVQAV